MLVIVLALGVLSIAKPRLAMTAQSSPTERGVIASSNSASDTPAPDDTTVARLSAIPDHAGVVAPASGRTTAIDSVAPYTPEARQTTPIPSTHSTELTAWPPSGFARVDYQQPESEHGAGELEPATDDLNPPNVVASDYMVDDSAVALVSGELENNNPLRGTSDVPALLEPDQGGYGIGPDDSYDTDDGYDPARAYSAAESLGANDDYANYPTSTDQGVANHNPGLSEDASLASDQATMGTDLRGDGYAATSAPFESAAAGSFAGQGEQDAGHELAQDNNSLDYPQGDGGSGGDASGAYGAPSAGYAGASGDMAATSPWHDGQPGDPGTGYANRQSLAPSNRPMQAYEEPSAAAPYARDDSYAPVGNPAGSYADDASVESAAGLAGSGTPGPRELEGPQAPSLVVHKTAPAEIQVGRAAQSSVQVRNVGPIAAHQVIVRDYLPRGARLIRTSPQASRGADGSLLWELGTLPPGGDSTVEMHWEPEVEGRMGSTASVTFQASATAATAVTKPALTLEQTGPRQVMLGDLVRFAIQISNPGSGTAEHVVVEEDVPDGLSHSAGRKLEYEVGAIHPGETRHLELTLKAAQPGHVSNLLIARAEGDLRARHVAELEVIAPELRVRIDGPSRRYLNRNAVYEVALENPGTADATNVDLVVQLPRALRFVDTNNSGHYDSGRHLIRWNLANLPAKKRGRVKFTVMPTEMGDHTIEASSQAQLGLADQADHTVSVDGVPALYFGVADASDPVEIGGQTSYEIRVVNQGSKTATNVQIEAVLPEGLQALRADGATQAVVQPNRVVFEPIAQLVPQQELKFRVEVRGATPGDWRFTVNMTSDDNSSVVTKQESTHVYSDQ